MDALRILVLDDMRERHDAFRRIYSEHKVTNVYIYSEFVQLLGSSQWDLIHLDHDLGDEVAQDFWVDGWGQRREYNGMNAVDRILELPEDKRPLAVVVHSVNSERAVMMVKCLKRAGLSAKWKPFGDLP